MSCLTREIGLQRGEKYSNEASHKKNAAERLSFIKLSFTGVTAKSVK
jgi:hypothetical protein